MDQYASADHWLTVKVVPLPVNASVPNWYAVTVRISYVHSQKKGGHTDEVLAASGETLVVCHVVEEVLQVAIVRSNGAGCNEAEHFHVAVQSVPKLPVAAANVDIALVRADGLHIPVSTQPVNTEASTKISSAGDSGTHQTMSS